MDATTYKGVNLMQIGPAEGHSTIAPGKDGKPKQMQEYVDADTLKCAMDACNQFKNGVKVLNTHGGNPDDIVGRAFNFRIEDNALRADVDLNKNHPAYSALSYAIATIPDNLGFSMGFEPAYEFADDKALVRPQSVYHFAIENETATTPDGIYSIARQKPKKPTPVDTNDEDNMDAETLKQINEAVSSSVAAAMEPYTKKYSADLAALQTSVAEIATYKKDFGDSIESFKKSIPEITATAITGFAKSKLGVELAAAPAATPAAATVTATKPSADEFISCVREGVKGGKFAKKTAAIEHFRAEKPDAWKAYVAAGSPNITL